MGFFWGFQAVISQKIGKIQIIFSTPLHHSSLSHHMLSVDLKCQRSTVRSMKIICSPFLILKIFVLDECHFAEEVFALLMVYNRFLSNSFGAMPRSILANILNWYLNLKIAPFTTMVKVKIKALDTYGIIVSSPKQLVIDRSKVKVTETAHWVLKACPCLKN